MKALVYKDETMGADYEIEEIPADLQAEAQEYREKLIEKVSESDDQLLEKYLVGEPISEDEIMAALRARCDRVGARRQAADLRAGRLRLGLQEQGRAAAARRGHRVPAVAARHPGRRRASTRDSKTAPSSSASADDSEPFAALAFKIMTDPFVGQLTFFRVYSGVLKPARR